MTPDPADPPRPRVDELLFDELSEQLERTRRLLSGNPEAAAEAALDRVSGQRDVELRIAAELAVSEPLADPGRFPAAHRLVIRALEVLDREGARDPKVPKLGPLRPLLAFGAEFVADYIVQGYAQDTVGRLRLLYARREAQSQPGTKERRLLAGARAEVERLAPGFAGGGPLASLLVVGGIALPALASLSNYLGAIDLSDRRVLWAGLGLLFALSLLLSTILLAGAGVARRRCRLILQQPLAALWATIGHAGDPPEDGSILFATIAVVLTFLVWVVVPLVGAALFILA